MKSLIGFFRRTLRTPNPAPNPDFASPIRQRLSEEFAFLEQLEVERELFELELHEVDEEILRRIK